MKKITAFLVSLLILSSCSNWKYGGKVRPSGNEVRYAEVVIEKNKVEPLVFDVPSVTSNDVAIAEPTADKKISSSLKITEKSIDKEQAKDISWIPYQDKVVENDDSLKKQDEILAQAMSTEKEAKKASIFGIIGAALSWTPAFIVGFIFSINGLKRSVRALRAPYITPKGLKSAKLGMIFSIIGLVISSIYLLAFMLLLLILIAL